MAGKLIECSDADFQETVGSGVTLVDFWAPWCGPCLMQAPILESVAGKVDGRAKVAKLNVDEGPQTAGQYGVRAIPTLILFKDGQPLRQFVGVQAEEELVSALEGAL